MKKMIISLLLLPVILYCQNAYDLNLIITDSVIVKKNYPYATKVNVEINTPNFQEPFCLYYFNKLVGSFAYYNDYLKENVIPPMILQYIIENENHEIIKYQGTLYLTYKNLEIFYRYKRVVIIVNSKQKIVSKKISYKKKEIANLAKYEVHSSKQKTILNLLLSVYHQDLPKGEYYLYLTYAFNPVLQNEIKDISNYSSTFRGSIVSNKVKLIVE